jgi:hypothetical protein
LIREAAYRVGYRNEQVIKQVQQAAVMQAKIQAAQMAQQEQGQGAQGAQAPGNLAKARNAQMAVPGTADANEQLTNQIQ